MLNAKLPLLAIALVTLAIALPASAVSSETLTCPTSFVAGSAAAATSLLLQSGSNAVSGVNVTWSTTYVSAAGAEAGSALAPTGGTTGSNGQPAGTSTASFASTLAGSVTLTATWAAFTGAATSHKSCSFKVLPAAISPAGQSSSLTCPSTFTAGQTPAALTLSLQDEYSNPIGGEVVGWSTSPTSAKVSAASSTTGTTGTTAGKSTVTLSDTVTSSNVTVSVSVGTTKNDLSSFASCSFPVTPAALNKGKSTLTVSSATATVAGSVTVTATAEDTYGNVDTNAAVVLSVADTAAFGNNETSFSGTDGVATTTLSTTLAGAQTITATLTDATTQTLTKKVTFTAGGISPAGQHSSLTCPSTFTAGQAAAELTLSLEDEYSNPIGGEIVAWTTSPTSAKVAASSTTGTTGSTAGKTTVKLTDTVTSPNVTVSVSVGTSKNNLSPFTSCSFPVTPAALNKTKSTLTVSSASATVPGPVTVTATAKDAYGNVDTNASVVLTVSGPAAFDNNATSFSGTDGAASTSLSTTLVGAQTITATLTDVTTQTLTKSVTFKAGTSNTSPLGEDWNFGSSFVTFLTDWWTSADGQNPIVPEVCLADAYGNAVSGVTVTFGVTGTDGGNKLTPPTAKTGANGCASTSLTSTVAYPSGEYLTWSVPGSGLITVTNPTIFFVPAAQAFTAPTTVNTTNSTLTFTGGLTSSSVASDGSVTVTFTVNNPGKPSAAVDDVPCSFYAVSTQSRFASDDNEWDWANTTPYFEDAYDDAVDNYSINGGAYASSVGQTTMGGVCTTTLHPAGPGWSITVYAEATGVQKTSSSSVTEDVTLSKVLTVSDGTVSGVYLGADSDYVPADGTSVQLDVVVTDNDGHPLNSESVTLNATPGTDCEGVVDANGDPTSGDATDSSLTFAGSKVGGTASGTTATVAVSSDATAAQYNNADGVFTIKVSTKTTGCYDITATSHGVTSSVALAFVAPISTATLAFSLNPIGLEDVPTVATVVVKDESGNGIPGQAVEFPTNMLWNTYGFYYQAPNGSDNPQGWCDVETNVPGWWPGNTCVVTDETGTASLSLGFPNDGQATLPTDAVDFLVSVHKGTLGYDGDSYYQKEWVTEALLPMTPVAKTLPANLFLVDYSGSTMGFAGGSSGSVPADGSTTTTIVVTALNAEGVAQVGVPVNITSASSSDTITPASGVTLSDGTFTFTISSTAVQAADTVVASFDGEGLYQQQLNVAFTQPLSASFTSISSSSAPTDGTQVSFVVTVSYDGSPVTTALPVTVSTSGGVADTVNAPADTATDGSGTFAFTVSSSTPQLDDVVTVSVNGGEIVLTTSLLFYPPLGQPSTFTQSGATATTFTATPAVVAPDPTGATTLSLVVTVQDASGAALANVPVTLTTTGTGNSFCAAGTAPCGASGSTISGVTASDGSGSFTVTLSSAAAQGETVTATIVNVADGGTLFSLTTNVVFGAVGACTTAAPGPNGQLEVSALIDGEAQLYVQGSSVWWVNLSSNSPGTWNTAQPTLLTFCGVSNEWCPEWGSNGVDTGYNSCTNGNSQVNGQYTAINPFTTLYPPLPAFAETVSLTTEDCRGVCQVLQQPSSSNGYTAIIDFNDQNVGGAAQYSATIGYAGWGAPANISVTPVGSGTVAPQNGDWIGTLAVAVTDAKGNPVAGQALSLTADDPIFNAAVTGPGSPNGIPTPGNGYAAVDCSLPAPVESQQTYPCLCDNGTCAVDLSGDCNDGTTCGNPNDCPNTDYGGTCAHTSLPVTSNTPTTGADGIFLARPWPQVPGAVTVSASLGSLTGSGSITFTGNTICSGIGPVDTTSDANNCSACGSGCTGAQPGCVASACTDFASDNNNCGAAGNVCPTGTTCSSGQCNCAGTGTWCGAGGYCYDPSGQTDGDPTTCTGATCSSGVSSNGSCAACLPPPAGIVGLWQAQGDFTDAYGNNDGTAVTSSGGTDPVTFVQGEVGAAFSFDGSNGIRTQTSGFPTGGADSSVDFWVRLAGPSSNQYAPLVTYGNGNASNGAFQVRAGGATSDALDFAQNGSNFSAGPTVTPGVWHHVAVTAAAGANVNTCEYCTCLDGTCGDASGDCNGNIGGNCLQAGATAPSLVTIYLDGQPVGAQLQELQIPAGGTMLLGNLADCPNGGFCIPNWGFQGDLDDVAVYNRALSPDEVFGIYQAGPGGKCAPQQTAALGTLLNPGTSCNQILQSGGSTGDRLYWINPDGTGAYEVYCDMTTAGGGWTTFFAGVNGSVNDFAQFEGDTTVCTDPENSCLRMLPQAVTANEGTLQILASCGAATIDFGINAATVTYLQTGAQQNWQSFTNDTATALTPTANASLATEIWTGISGDDGWIIWNGGATFASSYPGSAANYDYCNGQPDTISPIRLMYRY